jgi:hypothetical protein
LNGVDILFSDLYLRINKLNTFASKPMLFLARSAISAIGFAISVHALAAPFSGTCAMLYVEPVPLNEPAGAISGGTILAELSLTNAGANGSTVSANIANVKVKYDATSTTTLPPVVNSGTGAVSWNAAGAPFSTATSQAGVMTIGALTFNVYSVNNNKTLLVQGVTKPGSGLCQKN